MLYASRKPWRGKLSGLIFRRGKRVYDSDDAKQIRNRNRIRRINRMLPIIADFRTKSTLPPNETESYQVLRMEVLRLLVAPGVNV
jgi:hypothetical protein